MNRLCALTSILLASAISASAAIGINFSSPLLQSVVTSDNQQIDASYTFAVGTFNSFTPTSSNVSDWTSNWVSIGTTNWTDSLSFFSGDPTLQDNTLALSNSNLYIWGYNTQTIGDGAQWLLLSNDTNLGANSWVVPAVPDGPTLPMVITTIDAGTVAILGAVNPVGSTPHLQFAAVVPEPAHYAGILGAIALLIGFIRRRK